MKQYFRKSLQTSVTPGGNLGGFLEVFITYIILLASFPNYIHGGWPEIISIIQQPSDQTSEGFPAP
jgi:hypothetical protein